MELSHVYDQEVPWPKCEEIEVGGMSQSASVIESEDVEEESDEEDQEASDQCQNEEVRSRYGGTEEQTQVVDQVEERTFHHQRADGSQGTGDDAHQEAREARSTRRQRKYRDRTQ